MKNKKAVILFIILAGVVICLASSMAYFMANPNAVNQTLTVKTGTMALTFKDNSDGINAKLDFDEYVTKDFLIQNTGTVTASVNLSFNEMVNTYLSESLNYTLTYATSEHGEYNVVKTSNIPHVESPSKIELASGLVIPAGKTYYYRLTLTLKYFGEIDQTEDLNASFNSKFILEEGASDVVTIAKKIKASANSNTPKFNTLASSDEGVFKLPDDLASSYYFRGASVNNYVKFGKWASGTVNAGKDMYWRIIRINGDGSLRLIYDGTEAHENGSASEDRMIMVNIPWNNGYSNDAKYVGYLYGGANGEVSNSKNNAIINETSSNIKNLLEEWYQTNLVAGGYSSSIADSSFCNDRSTSDLGYGVNSTIYGSFKRLNATVVTPSFKCSSSSDRLVVNYGMGSIDYPVGLITADEVIAAGGVYIKNIIDENDISTASTSVSLSCPNMASVGSNIKCEIIVNSNKSINGVTGNFNLSGLSYVGIEPKNSFSSYVNSANGFAVGNTSGVTGTNVIAEVEFKVNSKGSVGLTNLDISDTAFNSYESSDKMVTINLKPEDTNYYLYKGHSYWTMSPHSMGSDASMFYVAADGFVENASVTSTNIGVVPVINLAASVVDTMIGSGLKTNPYRLN